MQRRHVSAAYGSQLHLTHPNNVEFHHTPVVLEGRSVDMETHLESILQRMVLKDTTWLVGQASAVQVGNTEQRFLEENISATFSWEKYNKIRKQD